MLRIQKIRLAALVAIFVGMMGLGLLPTLNIFAGAPVCVGPACTIVDTTINDFVQGQFYATGLGNRGDGEIQLLPLGLTSEWITETYSLPGPRKDLAAVIYRDIIYVIGGSAGVNTYAEIFTATTAYTGGIKAPGWFTATTLPTTLTGMPAVISTTDTGAYLYVLGGYIDFSGSGFTSTIFYRALDANGNFTGGWQRAAMQQSLFYHQAVAHGGYLYVLGGNDGSNYINSVYRAPINANGSLGAWVADTDLPYPSSGLGSFGITTWSDGQGNDYLYILGGSTDGTSTNSQAAVYYSKFNPDGSLGAWNTTGALLNPYLFHTALQNNAQILVIGGQKAGNPVNQVASAFIETDGSLRSFPTIPPVTWFESSVLPQPRYSHVSVVNSGGDVYLIAGVGTDTPSESNLIYRGASFGFGARYAPFGNFVSRIFNLTGQTTLNSLQWNTLISQTGIATITMQYRTSTSLNSIYTATWQTIGNAAPGINVTNTFNFPLNTFGRYFQYRALFTATINVTGTGSATGVLNQVQLSYVKPAPPDLKVVKTDNVSRVKSGDRLTYTINYTNSYPSAINNVVLTETIPANATLDAGASTPGWTLTSGKYILNVGSLNANESRTATIVLQLGAIPSSTTTIQNRVDIEYDREFFADENPGDNTSIDIDVVDRIDVSVNKQNGSGVDYLQGGQTTTYVINYSNQGTLTATNIILTETVGSGLTGNIANDPRWRPAGANVFTYNVGTLNVGVSGQITFTAQVDPNITGNRYVSNTVVIATSDLDVDLNNNKSEDWDWINYPNLQVAHDDGIAIASQNKNLVYTITVRNTGGSIAHNVIITETPSNLVTAGSVPGWTLSGSNYIRNVGDIAPGAVITYLFPVVVNSSVSDGQLITNTVRVDGSDEDQTLLNDNSSYDVDLVTNFAADLQITGASTTGKIFAKAPTAISVTVANLPPGNISTPTWFYVDLYVNRVPLNRLDIGQAWMSGGQGLAVNQSTTILIPVPGAAFPNAGVYSIYLQADSCPPDATCLDPSYGRIREFNEANNVFGPIIISVETANSSVYLPLIFR
jgi:uncharacterized repeat protein (TIGR01451 family)